MMVKDDGEGDLKRVYKKTFLNIFAIRKKAGLTTFRDKREEGKMFKYTFHDRQIDKNHVNSFPRDDSHYSRAKSEKEYLSPVLNINRMYLAYKI